ncbi:MAG: hypothetical protein IPP94_16550 [Ignavibacteria bacterium]|nr:hypothetical protein [Ignavibacteria bacterium]
MRRPLVLLLFLMAVTLCSRAESKLIRRSCAFADEPGALCRIVDSEGEGEALKIGMNRELRLELSSMPVPANTTVRVPLLLYDVLSPGDTLYPAVFTVLFDSTKASFRSVETGSNTMLEGIPVTMASVVGGIEFRITEKLIVSDTMLSGTLLELLFRTPDPEERDTLRCALTLYSWSFDAGSFSPLPRDGLLTIIPRHTVLTCGGTYAPPALLWSRSLKDYDPNPFTVYRTLRNTGDREARNVRFKIEYDKKNLVLVEPVVNVQDGAPSTVQPGDTTVGRWTMRAARRLHGDSVSICIVYSRDGVDSSRCCTRFWIPAADAVLSCTATAPAINAVQGNQKYWPMPFEVTVTVLNEGGKRTDAVFARLVLPKELRFTNPDSPDRDAKRVFPSILDPGEQGSAQWYLWHPVTAVETTYTVGVWVWTSNADSSYCEVKVLIPRLETPVLTPVCQVPDSLHYDPVLDRYDANPFDVTLRCTNTGALPATDVTGFMYLPRSVVLTNPGDSLRRAFPNPLLVWKPGDTVPSMKWNVTYTRKLRYDTYLDFKFVTGGVGPTGLPLDSVETWCRVRVPGLAPSFACVMHMPDSLPLNATKTDVTPNPFTVRFHVWNTSKYSSTIDMVDLNYPIGDGLTLDATTPKTRTVKRVLLPGDTLTVTWVLSVQNRVKRRDVQITCIAYDDGGNPVACSDDMWIANLETQLQCVLMTSESVIRYHPWAQQYHPTRWVITADLTNTGGSPLTDLMATLDLADSSLMALQELDPEFPDNTNPKRVAVLFPQSTKTFQWGFRLAASNNSGVSQFLVYNLTYRAKETHFMISGCDVPVEIEAAVLTGASQPPAPRGFDLRQNTPNPFSSATTISYEVPAAMHVRMVVYDVLRRGKSGSC